MGDPERPVWKSTGELRKLVTVDPDVYVVLDEKLFLFSNAEARAAFENEEPGIVQVADGKWAELESERAQKKGCFSCF